MIVADKDTLLIISGTGEVIEPDDGIAAIGSGGNYALAAARALYQLNSFLILLFGFELVQKFGKAVAAEVKRKQIFSRRISFKISLNDLF